MSNRVLHWAFAAAAFLSIAVLVILAAPPKEEARSQVRASEGADRPNEREEVRAKALASLPAILRATPEETAPSPRSTGKTANQEQDEAEEAAHLAELESQGDFIALADHVARMTPEELAESPFINRRSIPLGQETRQVLEEILSQGRAAIEAASSERGRIVLRVEEELCLNGDYEEYVPKKGRGLRIPEPDYDGQIRGLRTWQGKWVSVRIEPSHYQDLNKAEQKLASAKLELLHRLEQAFRD